MLVAAYIVGFLLMFGIPIAISLNEEDLER
jgi:hypothetical protein